MLENWYNLKKEFNQMEFYKCILGAEQHDYKSRIETELGELHISDVDEFTLQLYEELEDIKYKGTTYQLIGFLLMNGVPIKSLNIMKKRTKEHIRSVITSQAVYSEGGLAEIDQMFREFGFMPEMWIGTEIKHEWE